MKSRTRLLPLAMLALSPIALAQQLPNAGTQLRQLDPPPVPQKAEPKISIVPATVAATPGTEASRVKVDQLRFTGLRAFSDAELLAITGFSPGTELTLPELEAMAARITAHYRDNGYFVARAYLPAQDISNRIVTIAVSEGSYGEVVLRNKSRLSDGVAKGLLGGLESGDPITLLPLEHRLLLLSDVPGIEVTSTLAPGSAPGSSDLVVDIVDGQRVTGEVDVDNAGDPYTGEYRLGGTVNLNNLAGRGDVASLRVQTSGPGLQYARASYQMLFGRATAGIAYSRLNYELGEQFEVLGANGSATVASIFGSMPVLRSRRSNLSVGLNYDDIRLVDRIDLFPAANREAHARVATLSAYGNHADTVDAGAVTTGWVALAFDHRAFREPLARAVDASTARTNGSYQTLALRVSRMQGLSDNWSLYAAINAQLASKNLDSSEKFVLGGMDGVRAYPQGEAVGDEGYVANLEAHYLLAGLSARVPGQIHLIGFVDHGRITVNKDPWFPGPNNRDLSATGVGIAWNDPGNFGLRMYYAVKLGNEAAISAPDKSGRFWFQAVKYF